MNHLAKLIDRWLFISIRFGYNEGLFSKSMDTKRKPKVVVSWWLALLEAVLVRYVKIDDDWVAAVRAAAARGPLVFVLRNRSLVDLLCIRGLCRKHDLPQLGFVSGVSTFLFMPLWLWLIRLFRRRRPDRRRRRLHDTFAAGGSAAVFLRRPAVRGALGSRPVAVDGVRLAIEVQRELDLPVQAIPTVFLWGEDSMKRQRQRLDFVFGSTDHPRLMRSLWMLLRRRSVHGAWVAEPLDLQAIRRERAIDDQALAGVVRAGIGRRIEKIRRARLGSLTKSSARVNAEVLHSRRLLTELHEIAADEGLPAREVEPRARAIIKKLAVDFKPRVLSLFAVVMAFVWRRIYTGIDVGRSDVETLRRAVGRGPSLILPTHKSHIDYMVISQVMRDANIMLPHIAAGENLSFWPLGWLFRSSGAFFIRRRFISDRFYTAVVNAYIRKLVQEGYSIEVFIEGGRSRTGKLLRPKLGMLEMALRAMAITPRRSPNVVPVFIGYEQVIEERSYVNESEGRPKKSESVAGLFRTPKVLFHRYGRLHVRAGAGFEVEQVLADMRIARDELLKGPQRRAVALEVALRTFHEINRVTVATPSAILATVLLSFGERQIDLETARQLSLWLVDLLRADGVELAELVQKWTRPPERRNADAFKKTINAFTRGGRLRRLEKGDNPVYEVPIAQRLPLDYYKNNIVHFFAPASLAASCCLGAPEDEVEHTAIVNELALGCRLYQWEFMLQLGGNGSEESFAEDVARLAAGAVDTLTRCGVAERRGERVALIDPERARFLAGILRSFHEVYNAGLTTVRERVTGTADGDPARRARNLFNERLAEGRYRCAEGQSRLAAQSAFQQFKDLRILRPAQGERPFDEDGIGAQLLGYTERCLNARPR